MPRKEPSRVPMSRVPIYSWSNPLFVDRADPARVHNELEVLRKKKDDGKESRIAPNDVVEYAQAHPRSELHKLFPWDDSEAARLHRLGVARKIVSSIRVVYPSPKASEPQRVYLRPSSSDGYMPLKSAVSTVGVDSLRRQALVELTAWLRRYEQIIGTIPGAKTVIDRMVIMLRQSVEPETSAPADAE